MDTRSADLNQGLQDPLIATITPGWIEQARQRLAGSMINRMAHAFTKGFLRARFPKHVIQIVPINDICKEVAWPLLALCILISAMVACIGFAHHFGEDVSDHWGPQCVSFILNPSIIHAPTRKPVAVQSLLQANDYTQASIGLVLLAAVLSIVGIYHDYYFFGAFWVAMMSFGLGASMYCVGAGIESKSVMERCHGDRIVDLARILFVQGFVTVCLVPVPSLVGPAFSRVGRIASRVKAVTVSRPSPQECGSLCPICLESLQGAAVEPGDDGSIWTLPCSHSFHGKCVRPWLMRFETSCPTCRGTTESLSPTHTDPRQSR